MYEYLFRKCGSHFFKVSNLCNVFTVFVIARGSIPQWRAIGRIIKPYFELDFPIDSKVPAEIVRLWNFPVAFPFRWNDADPINSKLFQWRILSQLPTPISSISVRDYWMFETRPRSFNCLVALPRIFRSTLKEFATCLCSSHSFENTVFYSAKNKTP